MKKLPLSRVTRAFSLVEVVLALGLVSFCLLAVMGLLPMGLKSVKNAGDEAAATNALNQMGAAIRNATSEDGVAYAANGSFSQLAWRLDGASRTFSDIMIGLSGQQDAANGRFKAHVEIISPASASAPGHARVSIAWPAAATWTAAGWTKAEGSVSSGLIFLPR